MNADKSSFLAHVKWLRRSVMSNQAELIIAGDSMLALIRSGENRWALQPRFLTPRGGVTQVTLQLHDESHTFCGWLPYRSKAWPLSSDKLAFKRFLQAAGLPTPDFSDSPSAPLNDFLVKRSSRSSPLSIRGPIHSTSEYPLDASQGEFFERFVEGALLKVWFWDGHPLCAEADPMPSVLGDGVSTVRDLMSRRLAGNRIGERHRDELFSLAEPLLRHHENTLSTVLPKGTRQVVEFRHESPWMRVQERRFVPLVPAQKLRWLPVLQTAGRQLYSAIPEQIRVGTLFTVDAIIDEKGEPWLMEMDSSPIVHPFVYPAMVGSLRARAPKPAPGPTEDHPATHVPTA